MTAVELLLLCALLGVLVALVVGISDYVQREAKRRLAEDMVLTLREALVSYHNATGTYPPGRIDDDSQEALAAMLAERDSAVVLHDWPEALAGKAPQAGQFRDPWGRPFRYVTAVGADREQGERLDMDNGVPIFESSGPDGDFGDLRPEAQEDNLASDIAMIIQRTE